MREQLPSDHLYKRSFEPRLDVHEKPKMPQWALLSSQHLFAMFGATVLVPFLTGLPVSAALIASGIGKAHLDFMIGDIPFNLEGMALAALAGIILNAVLPKEAAVYE